MVGAVVFNVLGSVCTAYVGFMASAIAIGRVSPMWAYSLLVAYLLRVCMEIVKR